MTFSIIIPCYNTSEYLANCLESIIQQTYEKWEVILVDDGSTDNTAEVMRNYVRKDSRIKMFQQENKGPSVARNRGIREAQGDYILFMDSDDWYKNENSLQNIAQVACNVGADIITFQYERVTPDEEHVFEPHNLQYFNDINVTYTGSEFLQAVLDRNEMYRWYSFLYALKRKFWIENGIEFNSEIIYLEDADIIYQILLKAQKILVLKKPIYQYRVGRNGQLTQVSKKLLQSMINVCEKNINTVNSMDIASELKALLNNNFACIYYSVLSSVDYLKKTERKDIFYLLDEKKYLMSYTMRKKKILIRKIVCILGLHITAKLLFIHQESLKRRVVK